ncbi:MAG: serine/threonine-protein kinase [Puia sp.]|nr:serine/threonine-protein kinase [Puia sp.]
MYYYPREVTRWLEGYEAVNKLSAGITMCRWKGPGEMRYGNEVVLKEIYLSSRDAVESYQKLRDRRQDEYSVSKILECCLYAVRAYEEFLKLGRESGTVYLLMEYGGKDLEMYLQTKYETLTLPKRLHTSYQIADAICELRSSHLFYFELKPENLAIKDEGIKLIDYDFDCKERSTSTDVISRDRALSLAYAAPETICNDHVRVSESLVEAYCFGKIMYQIIFKLKNIDISRQFESMTDEGLRRYEFKPGAHDAFLASVKNSFIPDYKIRNEYTSKLLGIMVDCMQFDPIDKETGKRRITITEARDRLEELLKLPLPKPVPMVSPHDKLLFVNSMDKTLCIVRFNSSTEVLPLANLPADCGVSTITTQDNRLFVLGDPGNVYEVVFTSEGKQPEIRQTKESLKSQHLSAALVADDRCLYVIGGKTQDEKYLKACETYDFRAEKVLSFPDLSEGKAEMAACIFEGRYIYVFGGELDLDVIYLPMPTAIAHNFSRKIEVIDKSDPSAWKILEVAEDCVWGGCGLSAAVQVGDDIVILGGFLNLGGDYALEVDCATYIPATNKFTPKVVLDESAMVEPFFNNGYMLPSGKILCCSNTKHEDRCQSLCYFDPVSSRAEFSFVEVKPAAHL